MGNAGCKELSEEEKVKSDVKRDVRSELSSRRNIFKVQMCWNFLRTIMGTLFVCQ